MPGSILTTEGLAHPVNRRTMLRSSAAAVIGVALGGCAVAPAPGVRPAYRALPPVHVSPERVIRTVAGLRPYRASGFVVRADRFDGKTVVHNYGHGGSGITLSWGSSDMAAELIQATGERRVAVVGAGVMGLTTARLLQDRGFDVTIYTRELTPHTTSNVAGGQWSPASVANFSEITTHFEEQFTHAARFAHRYYQNLAGGRYGVRWVENYVQLNAPTQPQPAPPRSLIPELFASTETLGPGEHPFHTPYARRFSTMLIEPAVFLDTLTRDFTLRGGRIVVREFADLRQLLALEERVIANCTGIGAAHLFGDEELVPVKGQLAVLVPQPEVDYILQSGSFYMFPRSDGIVLGGSNERGVWSLHNDPEIIERIVEGNRAMFAGMRG
jgi:D-amino-acid oxidase